MFEVFKAGYGDGLQMWLSRLCMLCFPVTLYVALSLSECISAGKFVSVLLCPCVVCLWLCVCASVSVIPSPTVWWSMCPPEVLGPFGSDSMVVTETCCRYSDDTAKMPRVLQLVLGLVSIESVYRDRMR